MKNQVRRMNFLVYFEMDFYCLCSLQKSIVSAILTRFPPLQFQVPLLYVALLQIDSVLSFGASLFGNRFLYRAQHYTTKPKQAYRLRKPYQDKYGPYGDNLIHTVRFICLLQQSTPIGMMYSKKILVTYTTYIRRDMVGTIHNDLLA